VKFEAKSDLLKVGV